MSKARPSVGAPLTRKQLSRAGRERRLRGYILIGTVVVAVIVLGLIGYGVLDQVVLQPRQPVARVLPLPAADERPGPPPDCPALQRVLAPCLVEDPRGVHFDPCNVGRAVGAP